MAYPFNDIEKKWQKYWADNKTFKAVTPSPAGEGRGEVKPKYYALDMFPYPSGAGLHVGHPLGYIASDIVSRYKRLKGFNVLHPMGYDSFGLPAEQYAIQTGQHPEKTTKDNIARYREQMDKIGFSFDWDREVRTSDPNYYKWTQWIFIKLFNSWYNPATDKAESLDTLIPTLKNFSSLSEKQKSDLLMGYRLAYLSDSWVNWCPQLGTVLANEEVKDGVSERGGYPVERKLMPQWSLRITDYANRLLNDLDNIDWSESIKESQRNWIGKSEGSSLRFRLTPDPSPKERGEFPGYHTAKKEIWGKLKENARENRKEPTEAEKILWECVRDSRLGHKIRRQHAIDQFIADFVCLDKKLIIEVDGGIHLQQKEYDEGRTFMLEEIGYRLIRFTNEEVISKTDWVCTELKKALSFGEGLGEACIEVFTTRPDTIFGVTFLTLAPESELVPQLTTLENKKAVDEYVHYAKNRSERERQADVKKVTGQFLGAYAIHPFTGEKLPIWIGDYVLAGYGTGAVMGVPAHDTRDFAFAKQFGLQIKQVVQPPAGSPPSGEQEGAVCFDAKEGKCINSDFLNGLEVKDALKKIVAEIEKRGLGNGKTQFRLRDAIFGRQRYWGEPIPIYYDNGIPKVIDEKHLPLELPQVDKYLPTEDGEPPLARAKDWFYRPDMGVTSPTLRGGDRGGALETTTMPGWAGSSWYYLRYMDAHNKNEFASKEALSYWKDVDLYIGGSEHATGHLLYVRFWTKFLYDLNLISVIEPAKKLINQGMIQGMSMMARSRVHLDTYRLSSWSDNFVSPTEVHYPVDFVKFENGKYFVDESSVERTRVKYPAYKDYYLENGCDRIELQPVVEKMSKSKWNVVTPDDICTNYGADTLRLYEMFLGPLEQSKPWNTAGITGVAGFLNRFWRLFHEETKVSNIELKETFKISEGEPTKPELKILHKTIKKIQWDIENYSFNTSVSSFMIATNELQDLKCNKRAILEPMVILLSSFAPHIAEELWEKLGHKQSITFASFPKYDEALMTDESFAYPVSFNGKMRFNLELPLSLSPAEIEKEVLANEQSKKYLEGKQPKKVIVVPRRIVNIVV
jgi:leucyl-tRNA synthetase